MSDSVGTADLPRAGVGPPLPGAIGVSHLCVYDTVTPDGLIGGSAHVHLVCGEGYVVLGGSGAVQTLGPDGFAEAALVPGAVVWFTPGIVHRLVNHRELRILTLMQNAGLPEAGDAVLAFPHEVLRDADRYRAAVDLGGDTLDDPSTRQAAMRRRDLTVRGFAELRERVEADGTRALEEFYSTAAGLVRDRLPRWRDLWEDGPRRAAEATGKQIEALGRGNIAHLLEAQLAGLSEPSARQRPGMCGALETYAIAGPAHVDEDPIAMDG